MPNRWLGLVAVILTLVGCAANSPGRATASTSTPEEDAECDRRMVDEKVDLNSVGGKLRRANCLEAMKLKPQLQKFSPDVAKATLGFAECKAEARTRNLTLAQHQEALFECAMKHGGLPARACLAEMVMAKVPVDALEMNVGQCLQLKLGQARP